MPKTRNSSGMGSVFQRKDGRWVASITVKGSKVLSYHKSQKEAEQKLVCVVREMQLGTFAEPSKLTISDFTAQWLDAVAPDLKPTTVTGYRRICNNYIDPDLGHLKLQQLKTANVVAAVSQWRKKDVTSGTVLNAYRCLHRALACAVKWGLLAVNPCDRLDAPKAKRKEATVWSVEEAKAFFEATKAHRYHALWLFLAGAGCRLGEALGLTWEDVDWDVGLVTIKRSLSYVSGEWVVQQPKTKASVRSIVLPIFVLDALKEWRKRQVADRLKVGAAWKDNRNAVFLSSLGGPIAHATLREAFLDGCKKAGVPACRRHDLRHLSATLLVASGLDPKAVQARLGHSTITMTLQLYTHSVRQKDREAAHAMDAALG